MKLVKWVDRDGFKRQSLIRDNDPEEMAQQGIPVEPPDLDQVDWNEAKKLLHNALVDSGMFEWNDVVQKPNGISNACKTALKRLVTNLYRDRR